MRRLRARNRVLGHCQQRESPCKLGPHNLSRMWRAANFEDDWDMALECRPAVTTESRTRGKRSSWRPATSRAANWTAMCGKPWVACLRCHSGRAIKFSETQWFGDWPDNHRNYFILTDLCLQSGLQPVPARTLLFFTATRRRALIAAGSHLAHRSPDRIKLAP
jgi:hypothetical protein